MRKLRGPASLHVGEAGKGNTCMCSVQIKARVEALPHISHCASRCSKSVAAQEPHVKTAAASMRNIREKKESSNQAKNSHAVGQASH